VTETQTSLKRQATLLAWANWRLTMPGAWHPLKLTGTQQKGQMIVGNHEGPLFIIKWERPSTASHDGAKWIANRFKKLGVRPAEDPPAKAHFTECGWARDVQTREGYESTQWLGYAQPARLLLGVSVNGMIPEATRNQVVRKVLPTLTTSAIAEETIWAMHNVSFRSPAGFELSQRKLFSGDIALEFSKGKHEELLLRQVYPAELALQRRQMEKWLECYPFKQHRRLRRRALKTDPWQCPQRPDLDGLQRSVWKRLPSPLGGWSPRQCFALAAHDRGLDRLLIVEHMARQEPDPAICAAAIEGMNRGDCADA
jgi:hypothetical protein